MNKLLNIKHVHHLLELLIYTTDSIENISDLKDFVNYYSDPKNEKECMDICLTLLEYSMEIGANKFLSLERNLEYSKKNKNVEAGINEIKDNWKNLQTSKKIGNKDFLVEFWIQWTDKFRDELKRIDILKK
jgi:hypothetical protein